VGDGTTVAGSASWRSRLCGLTCAGPRARGLGGAAECLAQAPRGDSPGTRLCSASSSPSRRTSRPSV